MSSSELGREPRVELGAPAPSSGTLAATPDAGSTTAPANSGTPVAGSTTTPPSGGALAATPAAGSTTASPSGWAGPGPGGLDDLPEPSWHRPKASSRTPLSQAAIVDAALAVLDEVGMDGLSMRRVAAKLATGAASLYWHVRNKEELFQLIFERVAGYVVLPEPDPSRWKEQLKELGYQMRSALSRHRDVARLTLGRVPIGPQMAMLSEWLFTLLQPVGIPDRAIAYLGDVAGLYVGAYCFEESLGLASPTGTELPPEQVVQMMKDYMTSLPRERFPRALAAVEMMFDYDPEGRFEFGLDLLINGLGHCASGGAAN